ncbi:MAG: glutamate synthase large subunit [Solirubrobacterales bacterium]
MKDRTLNPERQAPHPLSGPSGLYDPLNEHDGCGIAFVAKLGGEPVRDVIDKALDALNNLEHRGAEGADPTTGDGAGILLQIPDAFYREVVDFELPEAGRYGVGMLFVPRGEAERHEIQALVESVIADEGQELLGWRDVPIEPDHCGRSSWAEAPAFRQVFIGSTGFGDQDAFERKLYVIRRVIENAADASIAIPSLSSKTVVYKGMLTAPQLPSFYRDLGDERVASALALVHSRFSTNTFPSWKLAHPYRMLCHNGEINTLRGNINWMRARESRLASDLFGDDLEKVLPVAQLGVSDSGTLDNVLEFLVLAGRSLPHAMMMMIPEPYRGREDLSEELRAFYAYHACLMEPWDGPAAVAFTDGRVIGASLDRNGLRPGRWMETDDGYVVLASETGALPVAPDRIRRLGRLTPGELFLVDIESGQITDSADAKRSIARRRPYGQWIGEQSVTLSELPASEEPTTLSREPLRTRQLAFGYSQEDLRILIGRMAQSGTEPVGSMGNDLALSVLSDRSPSLFSYFKQLFAQVTNPAIDPYRESIVMSVDSALGPELNLLAESPRHARRVLLDRPVLRDAELARLRAITEDGLRSRTIDITWPAAEGPEGIQAALERCFREADRAVEHGAGILILSDRESGAGKVAIPSLLACAAVHHHMVRNGTRLRCGLVVESGEPREIHHLALLIGYGAQAVNPYVLLESLAEFMQRGYLEQGLGIDTATDNLIQALDKGLLKILSKMGISTIHSYCGAQIFEAVGLARSFVDQFFTGTTTQIGGVGLEVIATEAMERHARAYPIAPPDLPVGGVYAWRRDGERRMWDPETVSRLRQVARGEGPVAYEEYARLCNEENAQAGLLRGLMALRSDRQPIDVSEVEPIAEITRRFATGGMSLGALSPEAHETLAVGMNRIGGRSNTGEGGEDPARFTDERRSSIKQVASGRFGVTLEYLVNADEIQIKVAQGAKPGEGGQLPGQKVGSYIAELRHSTPGVGLISPPPHHDIYSIEDLKQLIYDLRCANPEARVSVKLVSEVGVGTIAAGVAKANADHVVIAGHDGGTGASPLSSIYGAGTPWEMGLAETQQTLMANNLRDRIVVQTDGQMRTGRDVVIAAILGADEMAFSTAPLIATGCIMMRVCHMNTCPVGVATQDPELRARFDGKPEHVVNYLVSVAEEARTIMASLGVRTLDELIGRTEFLKARPDVDHWKARGVHLGRLLAAPDVPADRPRHRTGPPPPSLDDHLDHELIETAASAIDGGEPIALEREITNVKRTVGGILSSAITRRHGSTGLPEGSVTVDFHGSAGQSFGAWLAPGVRFTLHGDANDYVGKGLCGGELAIRAPEGVSYRAEENVIAGNTILYGATAGKAFFGGLAGERFAVRNSGAHTVVEGVGDHGCEYMTGGRVVILGPTGRNFGAGMSGGIAYVLDSERDFARRCNHDLVDLEELDDDDAELVRGLVAEHVQRTDSAPGTHILESWDHCRERFVKVMPRDYRRALEEAAAAGIDGTVDGVSPGSMHGPEPETDPPEDVGYAAASRIPEEVANAGGARRRRARTDGETAGAEATPGAPPQEVGT